LNNFYLNFMKTSRFIFILGFCCLLAGGLNSCYKESNPWDGLIAVKGPIAIVRSNTAAPTTAAAGATVTVTVVFSTLEKPVTKLNLYATVGTTARAVAGTTAISDAPAQLDRYTRTITYTVPAGTAANTRILLAVGIVTEGENEILTGNMTVTSR
jgi:hypothetical protein